MQRYLGGAQALAGVLVLLTPYVLFPVCTNQVETKMGGFLPMKCHWTAQAEFGMGALLLLAGLTLVISRRTEAQRLLSIMSAGLGVAIVSLPLWLIGMCGSPGMDCRVGTLPALTTLGGTALVISLLSFIFAREAEQTTHEPIRSPLLS